MEEEKQGDVQKKDGSVSIKVPSFFPSDVLKEVKKNPWIGATFILGLAVIVLIVVVFNSGSFSGTNDISMSEAEDKLVDFINSQTGQTASVVSSSVDGSLYEITVNLQGENVPIYVTTDGKYLISQPIPLDSFEQPSVQGAGNVEAPSA